MVLFKIEAEEAQHARDVAESGDGVVIRGHVPLPEATSDGWDDDGTPE